MATTGEPEREYRPGILDSIKSLVATLVAAAHNRLELVSTEVQEELARLAALLLWGFAALLLATVGLAFTATTVLLAVAPDHRVLAAGTLAALFLLGAGAAGWTVRRIARSKARPLDATLTELEKDFEGLTRRGR